MNRKTNKRLRWIAVVTLLACVVFAPMTFAGLATSPLGLKAPAPVAGLGSCPLGVQITP